MLDDYTKYETIIEDIWNDFDDDDYVEPEYNEVSTLPEYDKAITTWLESFINDHNALGYCTYDEWDEYCNIYKQVNGVRPSNHYSFIIG